MSTDFFAAGSTTSIVVDEGDGEGSRRNPNDWIPARSNPNDWIPARSTFKQSHPVSLAVSLSSPSEFHLVFSQAQHPIPSLAPFHQRQKTQQHVQHPDSSTSYAATTQNPGSGFR